MECEHLSVDQIFTIEHVFAIGRVTCECHAGCGSVAQVTEHHQLDVNSGSPFCWDTVFLAVESGPFVLPRIEDRTDCPIELLLNVLRKCTASAILDEFLETLDDFLVIFFSKVGINRNADFLLH